MSLTGQMVRNIRIEKLLGQGGMGEVYLGFDEGLKRNVAVKAIRDERRMNLKTRARFNREARVLSQLEHPNICRIYDYIQGDDCDFLIMEFISGKTLLFAGQEASLDFRKKIQIAIDIADVLAVAHEKQIVHRDLKPDNVMLTEDGTVKVLDFGLAHTVTERKKVEVSQIDETEEIQVQPDVEKTAREMGADRDDKTIAINLVQDNSSSPSGYTYFETEMGSVTGTPAFMSPEQARSESVSASSDMFSYGQLLHWLFTGSYSYPAGLDPTQILFRAMQGKTAKVRGLATDLTDLIERLKLLRPELRPTAVEAAQSLRWIQDKPRRKRLSMIVAAVIVSLLLTTTIAVFGFFKARQTARQAERSESKVRVVNEFLISMLTSPDPENMGIDVKVRDVLDAAAKDVDSRFSDHPENLAEIHGALGSTYQAVGAWDQAQSHLTKTWQTKKELFGEHHILTLEAESNLATVYRDKGRFEEAEEIHSRFMEASKREYGNNHPATMKAMFRVLSVWYRQARYDEAEKLCRELLDIQMIQLGSKNRDTLANMQALGAFMYGQGKFAEAKQQFEKTLELKEEFYGRVHPETIDTLSSLAAVSHNLGNNREAKKRFREVLDLRIQLLGREHPDTLEAMHSMGVVNFVDGAYPEALKTLEECLDLRQRHLGKEHPKTLDTLNAVACVHCDMGAFALAEGLFRECFQLQKKKLGLEHPDTLRSMMNVALALAEQKKFTEAESIYRENWALEKKVRGEGHLESLIAGSLFAECLLNQNKAEEAKGIITPILDRLIDTFGMDHRETRKSCITMGRVFLGLGDIDQAAQWYEKTISSYLTGNEPNRESANTFLLELADIFEEENRLEEAAQYLQRAAQQQDTDAQKRLKEMGRTW